jgi:hypothetical protein
MPRRPARAPPERAATLPAPAVGTEEGAPVAVVVGRAPVPEGT